MFVFVVFAAIYGFSAIFIESAWWAIPLTAALAFAYWSTNTLSKLVLTRFCKLKRYV